MRCRVKLINYGEKSAFISSIVFSSQDPMWALGSCDHSATLIEQIKGKGQVKGTFIHSKRFGKQVDFLRKGEQGMKKTGTNFQAIQAAVDRRHSGHAN